LSFLLSSFYTVAQKSSWLQEGDLRHYSSSGTPTGVRLSHYLDTDSNKIYRNYPQFQNINFFSFAIDSFTWIGEVAYDSVSGTTRIFRNPLFLPDKPQAGGIWKVWEDSSGKFELALADSSLFWDEARQ